MLYCQYCMTLLDEEKCPDCKNSDLRPPNANDPVHVLTKEALWSGGVEEALREAGIPYLKQGAQGSAMSVIMGSFGERYRYYAPYAALEKAREVLADFEQTDDADDADETDYTDPEE